MSHTADVYLLIDAEHLVVSASKGMPADFPEGWTAMPHSEAPEGMWIDCWDTGDGTFVAPEWWYDHLEPEGED